MTAADFIKMAELAHRSFEERRRFEWKINFSLWGALAVLTYVCVRQHIQIFGHPWEAWTFGAAAFCFYLLFQIMVARAHNIDKQWKHYFVDRAEGKEIVARPTAQGQSRLLVRALWITSQVGFTATVLFLAVRVLLKVT